ncbi:MAG: UDP-N-acetylmuramate dehydrogenase [Actinomycetaceae bacterium]|nr:UDP-N-acetylmuramate dehydrogenase [Actinomycetaceae bacterium]
MKSYPAGRARQGAQTLAELTTMQIGGTFRRLVEAHSENDIIDAIIHADNAAEKLLVIGGGSNILASDEPFEGTVVRDMRREVTIVGEDSTQETCEVTVEGGLGWDEFVAWSVSEGLSGIEALSGIPGTVGASAVQNIGAYGYDVSSTLTNVRAYDRQEREIIDIENAALGFGYRTSILKQSIGEKWGSSPRYVILAATFTLAKSVLSQPVAYKQLAQRLGIETGETADSQKVREMVLELRASKGMLLNDNDRDTYSCGSFFTNPVLTAQQASTLPEDAPRFSAGSSAVGAAAPEEGNVKTSAAWLIERAGFPPGYGDPKGAALSSKHCLALTNRGEATGAGLRALADEIVAGVRETFGVELKPEPIIL